MLSRIQGGYLWSEMQTDPEVIEAMAAILTEQESPPPLFGWTAEIDWLTRIGNQLIANRPNSDASKAKFYPQPVLPVLSYRKRKELSEIDDDVAQSQARYVERTQAVNSRGTDD